MAFSRLVAAGLNGTDFTLYGSGEQTRDFTYVGDVVRAMWCAAGSEFTGVANIGGGARTSMNQVLALVAELAGPPVVHRMPVQRGDVRDTAADIGTASRGFGYAPRTSLRDGLAAMVAAERPYARADRVSA
jgi:nucleoside-diphosphate-sugar epimerase